MTNPYGSVPHPEDSGSFEAGYQQNYSVPAGGYAQGYATQPPLLPGQFDCMRSIEQAWRIFKEKPAAWLVPGLIYIGIFFVLYLFGYIQFITTLALSTDPVTDELTGNFPWASLVVFIVTFAVAMVSMMLWSYVCYREAVYAVGGKRPEIKDMFTFRRVGILFLLSIVVGLLELVGLLALIIGVFVVSFFLMFAMPAIVFEDMSIGDALKSSYQVAKDNVGQALLLFLLMAVVNGIGGSVVFGVLLTQPLCYLAAAHAYMTATGRPVQERAM